jgi:hypothetical protein
MKIRYTLGLFGATFALGFAPALTVAAGKPATPGHSHAARPGPNASTSAKARAYGKDCQAESKKHVAGQKGTPFSQCVTAMAKLATNRSMAPTQACKSLSKKHVAGMKGTPYSRCIVAAAHLRGAKRSSTVMASAMAVAAPQSAIEAHAGPGAAVHASGRVWLADPALLHASGHPRGLRG